jgi:hypothetical protein
LDLFVVAAGFFILVCDEQAGTLRTRPPPVRQLSAAERAVDPSSRHIKVTTNPAKLLTPEDDGIARHTNDSF